MVFGERIRQAREIRGLTQRQLAQKVKRHSSLIAQIEVGMKTVSEELLGLISMATNFPVSFFLRPPLAEFPLGGILFRARSNVSRKALVEAARNAEYSFDIGLSLAKHCRDLPVLLPLLLQSPVACARATRNAMGIAPREPVPNLVRALERLGVWIIALPTLEGRDAFCVWARADDREIPVIAYCTGVPGDRLRLSIAHEVAHLVMHKALLKPLAVIEREAYEFGAELLVPESAIRQEMKEPVTLTSAARLKPRWGVSIQALIRRGYELRIITERQYRYLYSQLSANGWRTREPENLDVAVEKPRLLRKMAEMAYGYPINYQQMASDCFVGMGELKTMLSAYADKSEVAVKHDSSVSAKIVKFPRGEFSKQKTKTEGV